MRAGVGDADRGPLMPTLEQYLSLVPGQHLGAPRFIATLTALLQPLIDQQALLASMPAAYDLDLAIGAQLDAVGVWVGVSRFITIPIPSVFFSFDVANLGWDTGYWKGPFDGTDGLSRLDDESYRLLLRGRIAANHWDGTLAGAAAALAYIFNDPNTHVFIQDEQDGSFSLNVAGKLLSIVSSALLAGGYIPLKPGGIRLAHVNITSVGGSPLFGFDLNTPAIGGFGIGAWAGP